MKANQSEPTTSIEIQRHNTATIASLASSIASLSYEQLPFAAKHSALRCILDVIGCSAAGCDSPVVSAVVNSGTRWARSAFPGGSASVWFDGLPLSALGAAFCNSLAASVLDVDDGHRAASGHPGAAVVPAVIAVGEAMGARLRDAILAIICGYEAGVSVASARERFHDSTVATGRWSAVAVAAAVGKLRGLSVEHLAHAIAQAEALAPNMAAADHAGFAVSHTKEGIPWSVIVGIASTDQAAFGLKGYLGALDNPLVYTAGALPRCPQDGFLIQTTYFKPYACCRWTHSAIDGILEMREARLDPTGITHIEVETFQRALSLENSVQPSDIISAQFSLPFVLAVALLRGPEALLPMSPDILSQDDVLAMAKRVELRLDSELEACFPAQVPARVTVHSPGGTVRREVHFPLGDPRNPISDARLTEKAVRLCDHRRAATEVQAFAADLLAWMAEERESEPLSGICNFMRETAGRRVSP